MMKLRRYNSSEELREALRTAVGLKDKVSSMMRAGATQEEFERAGIRLVQFHD